MEQIVINFIDDNKWKRLCFGVVVEKLNGLAVENNVNFRFKSGIRQPKKGGQYAPSEITAALAMTDRERLLWLLDVDMPNHDEVALMALKMYPEVFYEKDNPEIKNCDTGLGLYCLLSSTIRRNKYQFFTVSTWDQSDINDLNKEEEPVENLKFPEKNIDLNVSIEIESVVQKIYEFFSTKNINIKKAYNTFIKHAQANSDGDKNHVSADEYESKSPFFNGLREWLMFESVDVMCETLGAGVRENYCKHNVIGETMKALTRNKLTLSGIMILMWGVFRRRCRSYDGFETLDNQFTSFFKDKSLIWREIIKKQTEERTQEKEKINEELPYSNNCRYFPLNNEHQTNDHFRKSTFYLVDGLDKLFLYENGELPCTQLQDFMLEFAANQLEIDLNISPQLIAALNHSVGKLEKNERIDAQVSECFIKWDIMRKQCDVEIEAGDRTKHNGYGSKSYGARGGVILEKINNNSINIIFYR